MLSATQASLVLSCCHPLRPTCGGSGLILVFVQDATAREAAEKDFRLGVKRRLHRQNFSESLPGDKEEKKRILQELYAAMVAEFDMVAQRIELSAE